MNNRYYTMLEKRKKSLRELVGLRVGSKARSATSGRLESSAVLVALLLRDRLTPRPDVAMARMGFGGAKPVFQTGLALIIKGKGTLKPETA
jgi:hypothetical protein